MQIKISVPAGYDSLRIICFQLSIMMCSEYFLNFRAGWVDCWSVPNFLLIIDYTWHPIYPQKADEQLKQSCKRSTMVPHIAYSFENLCALLVYLSQLQFLKWRNQCCQLYGPRSTLQDTIVTHTTLLPQPVTAGCQPTPRIFHLIDFMWRWKCLQILKLSFMGLYFGL